MAGVLDKSVTMGSNRGPRACVSSWSNGSSDVSMLYSAAEAASVISRKPWHCVPQPEKAEHLEAISVWWGEVRSSERPLRSCCFLYVFAEPH